MKSFLAIDGWLIEGAAWLAGAVEMFGISRRGFERFVLLCWVVVDLHLDTWPMLRVGGIMFSLMAAGLMYARLSRPTQDRKVWRLSRKETNARITLVSFACFMWVFSFAVSVYLPTVGMSMFTLVVYLSIVGDDEGKRRTVPVMQPEAA